jgi:thiamine-monophosphate kinase
MPVGIGDDAAVVEPERNRLEVLSVDALVEGVHFDRTFTPPGAIGHRALAVNLSDLAAMGAAPRLCLVSLALPPALAVADFDAMIGGLTALAARHRMHVAGGNLTRSPGPLVLDVTVIGTAKRRQILTRAGARPGDHLYVTGSVGAAAAGLSMLRELGRDACAPDDPCAARYLYPEPRVRMGLLAGRNRAASAAMDLSDGLADAVHQIAAASGVGAVIDADALPIDPAARDWFSRHGDDPVTAATAGGDDYELLLAVRPKLGRRLANARRHGGVELTRIGVCTEALDVRLKCGDVERPMPKGYHHFR